MPKKKKKTEKLSSDVPFKILSPIVYQMFMSISLISHVYIDFFEKCKFCAYVTVLHPDHPDIATLPHPVVWVLGWNQVCVLSVSWYIRGVFKNNHYFCSFVLGCQKILKCNVSTYSKSFSRVVFYFNLQMEAIAVLSVFGILVLSAVHYGGGQIVLLKPLCWLILYCLSHPQCQPLVIHTKCHADRPLGGRISVHILTGIKKLLS